MIPTTNFFQAVGTLTELRDLNLSAFCYPDKSLSREELLAIGKLRKLRSLKLASQLTLDNSVTNDDLVSFLSSFPEAEIIIIDASHSSLIPSMATIALATTSTRLRRYVFNAILDLGFVESSVTPAFPRVEAMYFARLHCPDVPAEG